MAPKVEFRDQYRSGREYSAKILVDGKEVGRVEKGLSSGYGGQRYAAIIDGRKISVELTLRDVLTDIKEWALEEKVKREKAFLYTHARAWVLDNVRVDEDLAIAYAEWYLDGFFGTWMRDKNAVLSHPEAWANYTAVKS